MTAVQDDTESGQLRRPRAVAAITFLVASFPIRLGQFVAITVLTLVGVATTVIWVGVPILMATTALVRDLGDRERRWIRGMLDAPLPPVTRSPESGGPVQRWRARLTDPSTWRDLAYLLLAFPLGVLELVVGLVGIVLVPIGIWVAPGLAWLHGRMAMALLGPDTSRRLADKARRLQASRARGVNAAESERRRIERDLHDGAQQRLVSLAMNLGRAKAKMSTDPDAARDLVDDAHANAKTAVTELRDLARGIYPAVLADRGLDAAASELAASCPVPVEISVDEGVVTPRPPSAVETCAYFIVGEALTNVAKHSGANRARVRIERDSQAVVVEITDDGAGGAQLHQGRGLSGLADRAAAIDGTVTAHSPPGGPTVIRAVLPCVW
ncbi:sensor histidine kinase [Haloechinothrix sp. YIM 98757]|uniref:histidine kinase n=1 Tax=Haloechinothrix aidingensis TaxID=2752311 RepID=A0A838ABD4_9PSEU|nr:sensor histidine kinase [Haloechinothrix aidingensis]MBA0126536.1 sensor histidine kinase [Haloechinothrix aidingensis]